MNAKLIIDGITILSEETYSPIPSWIILTLFLVAFVCFISLFIGLKSTELDYHPVISIILGIVFSLCAIMLTILLYVDIESSNQTQYKVTISDTVGYKEFSNKYKVLEREGEIYTIIEIGED